MDPSNCAKIPTSIFSDYNKFMNYLKVFCLFVYVKAKRKKNKEWQTSEADWGGTISGVTVGENRIHSKRKTNELKSFSLI